MQIPLKTYEAASLDDEQANEIWRTLILMEFQIINVFMSIESISQLHFAKSFGKHVVEVLERTKVLRAEQKMWRSGRSASSAFDITDQRDCFFHQHWSNFNSLTILTFWRENLCAPGFLRGEKTRDFVGNFFPDENNNLGFWGKLFEICHGLWCDSPSTRL